MIKKHITTKSLDTDKYVNTDTGEQLSSELGKGDKLKLEAPSKTMTISSEEYVIFNSEAIDYLKTVLSPADRCRVMDMSNMVKGECCVLCKDNNHPHTPESLAKYFNLSLNKFYELIRRLVKTNVLAYVVCAPSGHLQKIYMLNPYIARKRKVISCELNHFFRDVTKDLEIKD